MDDFKVDYVITYLDPTDPYWLDKFSKYKTEEFRKQPARYDVEGKRHLKFHFRCIEQNMPWINNVYLVVFSESQVPDWINRDRVKVITDDMYIPQKYLPTFNTSTKQMHLQFIPGLGEHFIFADDDVYSINPIQKSWLFDSNGNPKSENIKKVYVNKPQYLGNDCFPSVLFNSIKFAHTMVGKKVGNSILSHTFRHTPHPVLKSDLQKYYEKYSDYISKTITPCRDKKNVIGVTWCVLNNLLYGGASEVRTKEIQRAADKNTNSLIAMKKQGIHVVNINYSSRGNYYYNQFSKMFPNMSKYELYDYKPNIITKKEPSTVRHDTTNYNFQFR